MHDEFLETSQRPFPVPSGPWLMTQTWHHLLFCHWPVSSRILRKHVPSSLDIDLFDGIGWIGITPFKATNVRLRWLPSLPSLPFIHSFLEMNVRTYVTYKGTPGITFSVWMQASGFLFGVAGWGLFFHIGMLRWKWKKRGKRSIFEVNTKKKHSRSAINTLRTTFCRKGEVWSFGFMNAIVFL